jgi:competence protein ComEC
MASLSRFLPPVGLGAAAERFVLAERDQLPPWIVVAFGGGIAAWFLLPGGAWHAAVVAMGLAVALAVLGLRGGS